MEEKRDAFRVSVETLEGTGPLGRLGVDGRIVLRCLKEIG